MKTLLLEKEGNIKFPADLLDYKTMVVTMPYSKQYIRRQTIQCWFRERGKDKPYIKDGFISFKKDGGKVITFKVINEKGEQQFAVLKEETTK